jgi:glycosyltransferase involved in cell wall biosynthesis
MRAAGVAVMIVGDDAAARETTRAALAAQTVACTVCDDASPPARTTAPWLALVAAGAEPAPTALERACWFLAVHPQAAYVTGAASGHDAGTPLAAVVDLLVVRTTDAHAVLGADVWHAVGSEAPSVPMLALVLALALLQRGGCAGGWLAEPTVAVPAATPFRARALDEGRATLVRMGLREHALVSEGFVAPPVAPLQRLLPSPDAAALPAVRPRRTDGLRILALLQGFPMGGYTAFNADLLPRLAARGHDVVTCTTEWWRTDWRLDAVRAAAPDVHHPASTVPLAAIPAYVDHLVTTRGIDVLFTSHTWLGYRLLARLRARHPSLAVVDYVHTEWFEAQMYGSYAAMAAQWTDAIDAHVASSRTLAAAMVRDGAAAERMHVAHIGIDTTAWDPARVRRHEVRAALGAAPGTTVLLFAGRVSPEKRPLLAVDAAAALRGEGHDVRLVVAGGGPLLDAVRARVDALGLAAHAVVLGEVDEPTLRSVYGAADVFFAPSEIEGIARALYEAMAMGVVPVASDVGGQRELVVPGTGTLVAPQPGTLAEWLPALRAWMDPAARATAGRAARAHVVASLDATHTVAAIEGAMAAARRVRAERPAMPVPPALADELALLAVETTRRHVQRG